MASNATIRPHKLVRHSHKMNSFNDFHDLDVISKIFLNFAQKGDKSFCVLKEHCERAELKPKQYLPQFTLLQNARLA